MNSMSVSTVANLSAPATISRRRARAPSARRGGQRDEARADAGADADEDANADADADVDADADADANVDVVEDMGACMWPPRWANEEACGGDALCGTAALVLVCADNAEERPKAGDDAHRCARASNAAERLWLTVCTTDGGPTSSQLVCSPI